MTQDSRYPPLSSITLQCGPDGQASGAGLTMPVGRVNLFVGPNNSGKSLLLREVSGIDPRAYSSYGHASGWLPGRLVAGARYTAAAHAEVAELVKARVLRDEGDEVHTAGRLLSWEELLATMQRGEELSGQVATRIHSELARLCSEGALPGELLADFALLGELGDLTHLLRTLPLRLHKNAKYQAGVSQLLAEALAGARDVLAQLGLDTSWLPGADEITADQVLGTLLLPFVSAAAESLPAGAPPLDEQATAPLGRLKRLSELAPYTLDPRRWRKLHASLLDELAARSWGREEHPKHLAQASLFLDGLKRLTSTRPTQIKGFGADRQGNPLLGLLDNPVRRALLRALVHDALGLWLVVDMVTDAPNVHLRLSQAPPPEGIEEQRNAGAFAFMSAAAALQDRSDGIHAYVGMLAEIVTTSARLVFIDEPEAFLHPALARTLGRQLAELARRLDLTFFIATHSPELLSGCVAADAEAQVVRLTYDGEQGRAWRLDGEAIRAFTRDPLLRSAAALSGLFTQAVVICEGDSDRAFYLEIFDRLCAAPPPGGLPRRAEGWTFLVSNGWQRARTLLGPLRRMGIPVVAIIDADTVFADEASALMETAGAPKALRNGWKVSLSQIPRPKDEKGKYRKVKYDVIRELSETSREVLANVIGGLATYGVFVVPHGELEDWLRPDVVVGQQDKPLWLDRAFARLGLDPSAAGYHAIEEGGVWDFLRGVAHWVQDPRRKGMVAG